MASGRLVHIAEGESMRSLSSEFGQVWHIAASLLQDHEPAEVRQLLLAMMNAEQRRGHKQALMTVARRLADWG